MDRCSERKTNSHPGGSINLLDELLDHRRNGNSSDSNQPFSLLTDPKPTLENKQFNNHKKVFHKLPLSGMTIVVNPGHGGDDAGATYGGIEEKNLTFPLAKEVRDGLIAEGAKVVMTRTTDVDMELNQIDAVTRKVKPDAFLSIHFNANPNASMRGTTAYYWYPESKPYAATMLRHLVGSLKTLPSNGVLRNNYYVIDHTRVPAMLMEVAFISNAQDRAISVNPAQRKHIAQALVAGEVDYLTSLKARNHHKGASVQSNFGKSKACTLETP